MENDVDLLRELMVSLEKRQRSPRTTILLSLAEEAAAFGRSALEIGTGLDLLLRLEYIDGPGPDDEIGFWLFRKLTRKGRHFVDATRAPRDWERVKSRFGAGMG